MTAASTLRGALTYLERGFNPGLPVRRRNGLKWACQATHPEAVAWDLESALELASNDLDDRLGALAILDDLLPRGRWDDPPPAVIVLRWANQVDIAPELERHRSPEAAWATAVSRKQEEVLRLVRRAIARAELLEENHAEQVAVLRTRLGGGGQ